MPGPITLPPAVREAMRVRPGRGAGELPFAPLANPRFDRDAADAVQLALDVPVAVRPRVVVVGLGRSAPKTTQSLITEAVSRGMRPGEDIIATRYADLRVGRDRGFVRLAPGTGADGLVLAGRGERALFLFRGGGNLKAPELRKIAMVQAVDGATALTDLTFIQRAGSKSITDATLRAAGLAVADTVPVHGEDAASAAVRDMLSATRSTDGDGVAVLKKVSSLGGKDVHFVTSPEAARSIVRRDPDADYVVQEFLPHAKDQDVRTHMVYDHSAQDFRVANSYVRNRTPFAATPNLANGGYPSHYELSPWEHDQALRAARALTEGSPHPPLHVALDFFPRAPISATTVESNARLTRLVSDGHLSPREAMRLSRDTAVIGEAASSAGTKGTELVLGEGVNPVTAAMLDGIEHVQRRGTLAARDAATGTSLLGHRGS